MRHVKASADFAQYCLRSKKLKKSPKEEAFNKNLVDFLSELQLYPEPEFTKFVRGVLLSQGPEPGTSKGFFNTFEKDFLCQDFAKKE